jgi:hypothetical protein
MTCKNCNFENDSTARFCENCGASLQDKNHVQANKGLMKIIWGGIVLLYIGVIVCFVTGIVTDKSHLNYIDYETREEVVTIQAILSLMVCVAIWILYFVKQIKLSFTITAALLSIYALIGCSTVDEDISIVVLLLVFFAATITTLIYKYAFAENKKLL